MRIILIAAIGKNRELGKSGDLIWKLKDDLYRFSVVTRDKMVVMGRKTFESLPGLLPRREMVVLSKTLDTDVNFLFESPDIKAHVFNSINTIIEHAENKKVSELYVIGGAEIYNQFLPLADELDLTMIEAEDSEADTFFPEFEEQFSLVQAYHTEDVESKIKFKFTRWVLK